MQHIPTLALAVAPAALETASEAGLGGVGGPDLTRYFLVCGALLVGVVGMAWGFRKLVGRTLSLRAAKRSLQVMDVLPMGGKHKLAVVRCYDRTFLMGLGEKELSLVAELDPVIEPETEAAPSEADRRAFASVLERAPAQPPRGAPRPAPSPEPPAVVPGRSRGLAREGVLG